MLGLLFGGMFLTRVISDIMRKKNSNVFSVNGITGSLFYVFETSLFALFYFWALNGFKLSFNFNVLVYGLLYGLIVITTLVPAIFVYKYATFSFVTFVSGSASLILSLVAGKLLFNEVISSDKLLRVALMLVATVVIFYGNQSKAKAANEEQRNSENGKKNLMIACGLILFSALLGVASTVMLKLYANDPNVTDQNSFFFVTNIFSALLVLPALPFTMKRDKVKVSDLVNMVKSKKTVYSAVTTINSNINSIIHIAILGLMDVSVFTPLSSALSFAAVAIATPIIGEKLNRYTVISTVIAILSVILPFLLF